MESNDGQEPRGTDKTKSVISNPEERLRSSSTSSTSSSEFAFEDPLPPDKFEPGTSSPQAEESHPGVNLPKDVSALQSPPLQVMERQSGDPAYRIPSHVFARNKSGTAMEWSVASNESLFSIHTGNASYSREQFNWLMKSGELNYADFVRPGDVPKSGQLPLLPAHPNKSGEQLMPYASPLHRNSGELAVQQAGDVRPTDTDQAGANLPADTKPSFNEDVPPLSARESDASGKSFAFPVLTGEGDRGSSATSAPDATDQVHKDEQEETPPDSTAAIQEATQSSSWFSCLSCCATRS